MKLKFTLMALLVMIVASVKAESFVHMEPLKLEVPEMKPELVKSMTQPLSYYEQRMLKEPSVDITPEAKMDFDFFKQKTNSGLKPYKFLDDVTFVGIPVFAAGWIIKSEKRGFQSSDRNANAKTKLVTNFKTSIDDYTQFFGPVMTVGLKVAGYEGRSDWPRLVASSLLSYGIMAGFVNGIKYTAKEMRPDGSTANSWPSGHTATSFVGATILHKEYGLTRSPWFSVVGYGVATATGVMRILNNRHWISDVLSGAGIGIMSTELGYFLGDVFFKEKGLLRNDLSDSGFDNPSFFAISMGVGFGLNSLSFDTNDYEYMEDVGGQPEPPLDIDFHTASVIDAEGAYFFNKYLGVGGRLRVRTMTAKGWSNFVEQGYEDGQDLIGLVALRRMIDLTPKPITSLEALSPLPAAEADALLNVLGNHEMTIESDHLTEFSANVGLYLNLPLSKRFSIGSKFLIGRTMTQALDINSKMKGNKATINYTMKIDNGVIDESNTSITSIKAGEPYEVQWDYMTMGGNNSTTYGTGISLTYKYKSNFAWRVFCDYDYSKRVYTLTYDPMRFMKVAMPNAESFFRNYEANLDAVNYKKNKSVNLFTVGASFMVSF